MKVARSQLSWDYEVNWKSYLSISFQAIKVAEGVGKTKELSAEQENRIGLYYPGNQQVVYVVAPSVSSATKIWYLKIVYISLCVCVGGGV